MQTFIELTQKLAHVDDDNFPTIRFIKSTEDLVPQGAVYVFVGTGKWGDNNLAHHNFPYKASRQHIMLNNKGLPTGSELKLKSVTDFVLAAPEEVVREWCDRLCSSTDVSLDFSRLKSVFLILEDASPDTCFAITVFFARLAGLSEIPHNWVSYIRQWELGDVHSTGEYARSWAALQSALAHSYFSAAEGTSPSDDDLYLALRAGLRLLSDALTANIEPNLVPNELSSMELVRARQFQRYEQQIYAQSLRSATTIELSLPMAQSGRKMLISAYIAKEAYALGAIKNLARQDPNTWDGLGYGLMALYRPYAPGTGNDMVISVDPGRGVELQALWKALELREDRAWEGKRPRDNPRNIKSYQITNANGELELAENAPNQPWYDGEPLYTMIAAPRKLEDGSVGSRLTWDQVIKTLFDLYSPVNEIKFKKILDDEKVSQVDLVDINALRETARTEPTEPDQTPSYRYIEAHWPDKAEQGYLLCDTVWRYFAACIKYPKDKDITPYMLPKADEYDLVPLAGGTVLVHTQGVFALNDWSVEQLPMDEVKREYERAKDSIKTLNEMHSEIKVLLGVENDSKNRVKKLSKMRTRLLHEQMEQQAHAIKPELQALRETIERRLSLTQRITELNQNILEMHDNLVSRATAKTNRIIEYLTIFGFPAIFFASFFQTIAQDVNFFGLDESNGLHYGGLIAYLLFTVSSMYIIHLIIGHMGAKDARNDSE